MELLTCWWASSNLLDKELLHCSSGKDLIALVVLWSRNKSLVCGDRLLVFLCWF